MVVMFVDCCVGGGRYFPYYSYCRNPTRKEFFVPAGTLIVVKLLIAATTHLVLESCPKTLHASFTHIYKQFVILQMIHMHVFWLLKK
jgi:hypothetical protein